MTEFRPFNPTWINESQSAAVRWEDGRPVVRIDTIPSGLAMQDAKDWKGDYTSPVSWEKPNNAFVIPVEMPPVIGAVAGKELPAWARRVGTRTNPYLALAVLGLGGAYVVLREFDDVEEFIYTMPALDEGWNVLRGGWVKVQECTMVGAKADKWSYYDQCLGTPVGTNYYLCSGFSYGIGTAIPGSSIDLACADVDMAVLQETGVNQGRVQRAWARLGSDTRLPVIIDAPAAVPQRTIVIGDPVSPRSLRVGHGTVAQRGDGPQTETQDQVDRQVVRLRIREGEMRRTITPARPVRPAPRGHKEKKASAWGTTLANFMDNLSEASEVVDAVYASLPKDVRDRWEKGRKERPGDQMGQYGISGADWKLQAIYYNWHRIDAGEAVANVIANEIEDRLYGAAYGARDRLRPRNVSFGSRGNVL